MKHFSVKHFILLSFLLLSTALSGTANNSSIDQRGNITIKVAHVEGAPKDSSFDATINGHALSPNTGSYIVTFTLSNGDVYYGEFKVTD